MVINKRYAALCFFAVLVSSCATPQLVNTQQIETVALEQVSNSTKNPAQSCEAASMAIAKGNKLGFYFYAPLHLNQAVEHFEDGQEMIKQRETAMLGAKRCFKAVNLINSAIQIKAKVKTSLKDSLNELRRLKKADKGNQFSEDIQDSADDVVDLVKLIEAGKMNEAMQGQSSLLKDMLDLEIEIVTSINLKPVETMIEKAEDVDADELAEKTFDKAELELESAKKFIEVNYRNHQQVAKVSAAAMRAAKHAFYVAKEVETLKLLKPDAAEEKILHIESLLEGVNKKFKKDLIVGHSIADQLDIIGQRLDAVLDKQAMPVVKMN